MIPGLDGLRAIAFLMVFGFHTDYFQFGWLGVQMFFVLSGYLISGILLQMKRRLPPAAYFLKFYVRRFLRIFPLYYFYLFLVFVVAQGLLFLAFKPKAMQATLDQLRYAALYVYNFYSAHQAFNSSRFLDHLWSLSVEEQFYIFWPLLIFFVPEKRLKALFLAGIFAGPACRLAAFLIYQSGMVESLRDPAPLAVYPLPFSYIDAFAFGAYIARFSIPHARRQLTWLGLGIPLLGFASQFAANGRFEPLLTLGYPDAMPDAYQYLWGYTLVSYWFMLLIYCVAREGLFLPFLEWAPLRYLGKISYGLYIYHFPIIWLVSQVVELNLTGRLAAASIAPVSLIISIIAASASYFFVEKPFLSLKERLASYSGVSASAVVDGVKQQ